jgi:phosphoglycolate phosphatase-like HAD superfamily hydrolase
MTNVPPIKAVIFDLDGTLADTLPVCIAAFQAAFERYAHRSFTAKEIEAMFGPNEEGVIRKVVPDDWEACLATYLCGYETAHQSLTQPFDGVLDLVVWLKERDVPTAIVTGKGAGSAAISIRLLGLAQHFDIVEMGSPQGVIKPQAITKILAHWHLRPDEAVYVGDAPGDIVSAREAGVAPIAAAWASSANVAALEAMSPIGLFRSVAQFRAWLEERVI